MYPNVHFKDGEVKLCYIYIYIYIVQYLFNKGWVKTIVSDLVLQRNNKIYLFINSAQNHLNFMFHVVNNFINLGL